MPFCPTTELIASRRPVLERPLHVMLAACALFSVLITVVIFGSIVTEAVRFFHLVPLHHFLFGLHWSPQGAGEGVSARLPSSLGRC